MHGKHHHHGKVAYLDNSVRKKELSPDKLLSLVPIKETAAILDFGAGTGYFTIPAAKAVTGKVYALDIDSSMLDMIMSKALQEDIQNIVPLDSFTLPDASIDVTIASLVLHEIKPLDQTLRQIKDALKEGGYLLCVELEPKGEAKPEGPRISAAGMEQAIADAGLKVIEKLSLSESLYVLIAQKK